MVKDVSAILVDTTTLRPGFPSLLGGGGSSKMRFCCWGGKVLYSGITETGPT